MSHTTIRDVNWGNPGYSIDRPMKEGSFSIEMVDRISPPGNGQVLRQFTACVLRLEICDSSSGHVPVSVGFLITLSRGPFRIDSAPSAPRDLVGRRLIQLDDTDLVSAVRAIADGPRWKEILHRGLSCEEATKWPAAGNPKHPLYLRGDLKPENLR